MMPKPILENEDSSNYQLYLNNRFSVVRQMRYSTAAEDSGNELDFCILLNGLPIMTFELKMKVQVKTMDTVSINTVTTVPP